MNAGRASLSTGLFLAAFAVLALSGPGRIDVIDGQVRYEVARSVVDWGDWAVHDPDVRFTVFPGRDGKRYSYYRFPQSALGVPAIMAADATGPRSEPRRHFFFVLTSALAGAVLSLVYLAWFRRQGMPETQALFWAAAGILCTPNWFYSTSTFDDILGTLAVVAAIVVAAGSRLQTSLFSRVAPGAIREKTAVCRRDPGIVKAMAAGLLIGLAFNCKPPLAVFGLAAVAVGDDPGIGAWRRLERAATIALGLLLGIAAYLAYDLYRFPPAIRATHAALAKDLVPMWPGDPVIALLALAVSPGAGVLWYSPTLPLCLRGFAAWARGRRALLVAIGGSVALFTAFIASISYFKGDLAWGPRYLTPVFAVLWLFAERGSRRWPRRLTGALLILGVAVQLAALSVVPSRLYLERRLPLHYGVMPSLLYFDPANAHVVQRPREIAAVWAARHQPGEAFSPLRDPTAAPFVPVGGDAIARYKMLNSFRPWWASQIYLPEAERPVSLAWTLALLLAVGIVGVCLVVVGVRAGTRKSVVLA